MKNERQVILHKGIYKKTATTSEAVFMITGMTIGAGILGVPYVVAQVGLVIGLVYIIVLGIVMMSLNLLIGEVAVRAKVNLQLPGLAGKYLGKWAKNLLSATIILSGYGSLLAYVVGEGEALSALFGGDAVWWSVFFWSIGSFLIWRGLQTVKKAERVLSFTVITIIVCLSLYIMRDFRPATLSYFNWSQIFLPYGVILFALHASPAIAEAHALLPGSHKRFRKAVIIGSLIPTFVYVIFALAVVGVTGSATTEVATVGIGQKFGNGILMLANLFAVLAMGTAFMGMGMALKQTFVWDRKLPKWVADILVIVVPLGLFAAGLRSFILILDFVGGVFIGFEAILMVMACWSARKNAKPGTGRFGLPYFWLLAIPVLLVFTAVTVYSIIDLFI